MKVHRKGPGITWQDLPYLHIIFCKPEAITIHMAGSCWR